MANGKLGDHPLTDMLIHGKHPFPEDMEAMLREILAHDKIFPDGKRPYIEQIEWTQRFFDWEAGKNLDEGRAALRKILTEIHGDDTPQT